MSLTKRYRLFIRKARRRLKAAGEAFAHLTVDVIYDREQDGGAVRSLAAFLKGLSLLFTGVVKSRLFLYQERILRNHHLGCLVIVVGNLTVGGTGKTPVVEKLARSLNERGRKVAILSRGYKSRKEPLTHRWWRMLTHSEPPPPKVVSDGKNVLLDSEVAGDEPYMLARNLPGVAVVVDKDRVKAGLYAIRKFQADTLILDDGFQYFALKDHLQLLLIDKTNPFGNRSLLPRGVLREPVEHLRRASHIFLTKSDGRPDPGLDAVLHKYNPDADIIECTHEPRYLQEINGVNRLPLEELKGLRVFAFCGIAVPESFEKFLSDYGAVIAGHKWFLDHHRFDQEEIDNIFHKAKVAGATMVVTTEKDSVRIPHHYMAPLPLYYLRVEIELIKGADNFDEVVERICFPKLVENMRAE